MTYVCVECPLVKELAGSVSLCEEYQKSIKIESFYPNPKNATRGHYKEVPKSCELVRSGTLASLS